MRLDLKVISCTDRQYSLIILCLLSLLVNFSISIIFKIKNIQESTISLYFNLLQFLSSYSLFKIFYLRIESKTDKFTLCLFLIQKSHILRDENEN